LKSRKRQDFMNRKGFVFALLLAFIILSLPLAAVSKAQEEPNHFAVEPVKEEFTISPGTSFQFAITVENYNNVSHTMDVRFMDYSVKPDNTIIYQKPGHYSYSCATWLSTDTPQITLPPRGTAQFSSVTKTFNINVPSNAEPGGHYGCVMFQEAAPEKGNVRVSGRIPSLVLITVPGNIICDAEIKSVSVSSSWFWPTRPTHILPCSPNHYKVVIENKGNIHVFYKVRLSYTPTFGWGFGTVTLPQSTLLPKETRNIEGNIPKSPAFGSYNFKVEMAYGQTSIKFDTTKTKSCGFNSYPILTILLILLVIMGLVFLVRFLIHRFNKDARKKRKSEKMKERSWTEFGDTWEDEPEKEKSEGESEIKSEKKDDEDS